jgi:hypothetical protein
VAGIVFGFEFIIGAVLALAGIAAVVWWIATRLDRGPAKRETQTPVPHMRLAPDGLPPPPPNPVYDRFIREHPTAFIVMLLLTGPLAFPISAGMAHLDDWRRRREKRRRLAARGIAEDGVKPRRPEKRKEGE